MNSDLNIHTILGYVANAHPLRASRDGKEFEGILPAPTWTEVIVKRDGSVTDTVHEMQKLIRKYAWQTAKLAPLLKGKSLDETCGNIWNFLFTHIKYKEDEEGKEQLRPPARSWAERLTRGIDCDDFSLFAGCLLYNLNIPYYIRIARYEGKSYFQHVYVVVPQKNKQYITIDAVLDEYDTEKQPIQTKDFLVMNTNNLNGIDISMLGSVQDDTLNELSGILTGVDFEEVAQMEGLGRVASRDQELGAIKNHLIRTRSIIARKPEWVQDVEHPESFLGMVDYALKYWDTNQRDAALDVLSGEEDRQNTMEGVDDLLEGTENIELLYGLNALGYYDVLGKAKKQKKFFAKVKQAVKKAGQGIKKVAKKLVRFNPLTVTIRAAVLLALKVNLLKISTKLKWGYLTEQEAQTRGFDMAEWRKVKAQLAKAENLFVNTLQGKAENFKRAILSGRGGGLSGTNLGLGVVVAATTAASTTAAVPFITKLLKLLKNINFSKLISKVNVSKLAKGKKAAETDNPTEEGESAIPENEPSANEPTDNGTETTSIPTEDEDNNGNNNATPKARMAQNSDATDTDSEPATESTETAEGMNTNASNLPATVSNNAKMMQAADSTADQVSIVTKAVNWVKENKPASIAIGLGSALILYQLLKPKKKGLSGVRRGGKKKKGKAKTHPPRSISGVTKKAPPKKTTKKRVRKKPRKPGKGGKPKSFKL